LSTNPASADRRRLAELADGEQRDRLFGQRPDLVRRETVRWLGEETARQVVVDLELARRLAATALRLAETLGDPLSTALAWRAVANTLLFGREYPAAASAYETAIDELDRLGEQHQAAITRSSAISCLSYLGHYDQATEYAAEARRQFRLADDTLRLARLENNVAHLLARRDRFADALDHYRQAHSLLSQMGEPADVAMVLRNTAVCHQELGDLEQALSSYAEARSWCARNGLDRIGLEVEYNAAYLCFLRGEYTRALTLFEAVRRSCEAAGDEHHRALCDLDQAEIFLELNLVSDAALLAERCIDGFAVLGMDYELAKALAYAGLAAARRDDVGSARTLWARARRLFEGEDNEVWVAMVDLYEAHSQHTSGRHREAEALAATALATFTRFAIPSRQAACEILLARLALESRDRPRAGTLVADALAHATSAGRPILELQAHLLGGLVEEAAGNGSAALTALERAEATLERMRGQLVTDELKIAFGDDKQAIYEALVTIGLASDSTDREQRAFENVEKAKSRGLAELALPPTRRRGAQG
jgi:tetratricopeptide (TPR) repeat protein